MILLRILLNLERGISRRERRWWARFRPGLVLIWWGDCLLWLNNEGKTGRDDAVAMHLDFRRN